MSWSLASRFSHLEDTAPIVDGDEGKSLVGKAIESSLGV